MNYGIVLERFQPHGSASRIQSDYRPSVTAPRAASEMAKPGDESTEDERSLKLPESPEERVLRRRYPLRSISSVCDFNVILGVKAYQMLQELGANGRMIRVPTAKRPQASLCFSITWSPYARHRNIQQRR